MIVGWPLTFLQQDQICVPMHLYGENVEKFCSQNVLKTAEAYNVDQSGKTFKL